MVTRPWSYDHGHAIAMMWPRTRRYNHSQTTMVIQPTWYGHDLAKHESALVTGLPTVNASLQRASADKVATQPSWYLQTCGSATGLQAFIQKHTALGTGEPVPSTWPHLCWG